MLQRHVLNHYKRFLTDWWGVLRRRQYIYCLPTTGYACRIKELEMGYIRTAESNQGLRYPFEMYIQIWYHCHTSVTQIPKWVRHADHALTECVRITDGAGSPWGPIHSCRDHHHKHPGSASLSPSPRQFSASSIAFCATLYRPLHWILSIRWSPLLLTQSQPSCFAHPPINLARCLFPSLALLGLLLSPPSLLF